MGTGGHQSSERMDSACKLWSSAYLEQKKLMR